MSNLSTIDLVGYISLHRMPVSASYLILIYACIKMSITYPRLILQAELAVEAQKGLDQPEEDL